jgi:hypothetical protein
MPAASHGFNAQASRCETVDSERNEDLKEALLEYHARLVPEGLDGLASEQRRNLYRMMLLKVLTRDGELISADWGCNASSTPLDSFRTRGR